jgi:hypothetical protein
LRQEAAAARLAGWQELLLALVLLVLALVGAPL